MVLEVKKQEKESSQGLVRRFSKRVQRSGILLRARKNRFRGRVLSCHAKRKAALRRNEMKVKYDKLMKLKKPR